MNPPNEVNVLPLDHLGDVIMVGGIVVGHIVWLIRLEGKANYNERAIAKLEVKHDALDSKIVDKLSVIEKSLAKIEGRLSIENEEKK